MLPQGHQRVDTQDRQKAIDLRALVTHLGDAWSLVSFNSGGHEAVRQRGAEEDLRPRPISIFNCAFGQDELRERALKGETKEELEILKDWSWACGVCLEPLSGGHAGEARARRGCPKEYPEQEACREGRRPTTKPYQDHDAFIHISVH